MDIANSGSQPTDDTDPSDPTIPTDSAIPDETGHLESVGPYKLLGLLGEGGMGTVYLAEQKHPVRRRVALKLIKLGMDSKETIARFQAERQALAMMEHDNIAKVYDAGTTELGQLYFVMEHVPGTPITQHCDKHKLSTRDRLRLFQQVCSGVQHAHEKGVIHRDLKPSNILVSVRQGRPIPKIIDFGVARATDHSLVQATIFTEQGSLIGTPEYMSPEQAEMSSQDIDPRTDVYSLGVILYELLVGELPFSPSVLRKAGLFEIRRVIREDDPPRPSVKLSSLRDASTQIADSRRTSVTALSRVLSTDLDWVVLKAMDKERHRRYQSATELDSEIRRYLRGLPLDATPPTAVYRLRKLLRRHQTHVTVCLLGILLLGAAALATNFAFESTQLEELAGNQGEEIGRHEEQLQSVLSEYAEQAEEIAPQLAPETQTRFRALHEQHMDLLRSNERLRARAVRLQIGEILPDGVAYVARPAALESADTERAGAAEASTPASPRSAAMRRSDRPRVSRAPPQAPALPLPSPENPRRQPRKTTPKPESTIPAPAPGLVFRRGPGVGLKPDSVILHGSSLYCSNPAVIQMLQVQRSMLEGIEKGTVRHSLVTADMDKRIRAACKEAAEANGHDCVVRSGDITDTRTLQVLDLTIEVLAVLKRPDGAASSSGPGVVVKKKAVVLYGSSSHSTRPAVIDMKKVEKKTPEHETIKSEGIRKGSARYQILVTKMHDRIKAATKIVAAKNGNDCVLRRGDIQNTRGLDVTNLTDAVIQEIKSPAPGK